MNRAIGDVDSVIRRFSYRDEMMLTFGNGRFQTFLDAKGNFNPGMQLQDGSEIDVVQRKWAELRKTVHPWVQNYIDSQLGTLLGRVTAGTARTEKGSLNIEKIFERYVLAFEPLHEAAWGALINFHNKFKIACKEAIKQRFCAALGDYAQRVDVVKRGIAAEFIQYKCACPAATQAYLQHMVDQVARSEFRKASAAAVGQADEVDQVARSEFRKASAAAVGQADEVDQVARSEFRKASAAAVGQADEVPSLPALPALASGLDSSKPPSKGSFLARAMGSLLGLINSVKGFIYNIILKIKHLFTN